jgi:flagellar protein FliO/FliZ
MRTTRGCGAVGALLAWACWLPARAALPTVATSDVLPAASAAPSGASGLLQAGLGMLLVLGLIFGCAWAARRFGLQRFGGADRVKVVASAMVGQRERVVVVEIAGTWLVLGVAAGRVNALHTMTAQER